MAGLTPRQQLEALALSWEEPIARNEADCEKMEFSPWLRGWYRCRADTLRECSDAVKRVLAQMEPEVTP